MKDPFNLIKSCIGGAIVLVATGAATALTVSFNPDRAASGVSWAPNYSVSMSEGGTLAIGALDNGGTALLTAGLLGFDVSSLAGKFVSIESVTLTAYVKDKYNGPGEGTVNLARVSDVHSDWTSNATWAQDGSNNPWRDGATMGTAETATVLASTTVIRNSATGTAYTWTITGAAAQALINDWVTGTNSGLALADTGTGGGVDYRTNVGGMQGTVPQPTLAVTYTPVYVPASLTWKGADGTNPTFWDVNGTANWTGGVSGKFLDTDQVLFDDSAAARVVDIQGVVQPSSLIVNNTAAYTLSSSNDFGIDGSTALVKMGSGLCTITAPNTFRGGIAIQEGTVSIPAIGDFATPLGQGSLTFGDATHSGVLQFTGSTGSTSRLITIADGGGTVDVTQTDGSLYLVAGISGTGALTKSGPGILGLSGNCSFVGGTTVNAGTLSLNRPNGGFNSSQLRGVLTINSGAILALNGFPFGYGGGLTDLNVNDASVTGTGLGTFGLRYHLKGGSIVTFGRMDLGTYGGIDGAIDSLAHSTTAVVDTSSGIMMRGDSGQLDYRFAVAAGTSPDGIDLKIAAAVTENVGPCSIIKAGAGTLELSGANSYSGATTIEAGTLKVNGNSIADGNKLVLSGGKLALATAANETVNSLYFGDALQVPGTYGSSTSTAAVKDDTHFSGSGILTVTTGAANVDYDTWLGGFTFASGADTTPAGDPDGDGLRNRQEYAFGLNPTSGSSVSPMTAPLDKLTGSFTYTRRKPSLTKLAYKIWTSPDLSTWTEDTAAIQTPSDTGDNQSVAVALGGTKPLVDSILFVRVTAE